MTSNGVMPGSRRGTFATSMSMPTPPRAAHSTELTGQPRCAEILHCDDIVALEQLEAGLEQQLLEERIADLDDAAVRCLGILDRGERRAVKSVAAGLGADDHDHIADAEARARISCEISTTPTHIALTSGFPLYDSSKKTSPPTFGMPRQLP